MVLGIRAAMKRIDIIDIIDARAPARM